MYIYIIHNFKRIDNYFLQKRGGVIDIGEDVCYDLIYAHFIKAFQGGGRSMYVEKGSHCPICQGVLRVVKDGRRFFLECSDNYTHYCLLTFAQVAALEQGETIEINDFPEDPDESHLELRGRFPEFDFS